MVRIARRNVVYGLNEPLQDMNPLTIVSQRAPTAGDSAQIGCFWVDVPNNAVYCLVEIVANQSVWVTSPASGATTLASLTINAGDLHLTALPGNIIVDQGDLTLTSGNAVIGGDLSVTGNVTINGDFDLTDTASISLTSTNNAARAIYLHANGGVNETIELHSDQGTGAASVLLTSDVGGVTLSGGLGSADAINIVAGAVAGGIDVDAGTGGFIVDTTGAFSLDGAAASNITTTGAGIDLTLNSVLGSVLVRSTEDAALAIRLHANGGTSETIQLHSDQGTGVGSINLLSDVGGLTLRSTGLASADAINLEAAAGGIDVDAALQINIASSQNAADAVVISASAGGIDITATGTAGEDIDLLASGSSINLTATEDAAQAIYLRANGGTSETIQLHADQGTAVNSLNLLSDVGGITLRAAGLASADAINLEAVAGGVDVDAALQINVASSQAAVADAVRIVASAADGGIDVDAGTGGIALDSTGAFSIDGAAASNVTVTGAGADLLLSSALGSVLVRSTEDAALAIRLHANGGVSETIQLHSDQGTGVGSINLLSDVGGITLTATGLASADAINLEASAGGVDVDAALQVNVASSQAAADALRLIASNAAGGIDVDAGTGGISLVSTGGSVVVTAGVGANGSVTVTSTGTGDIVLDSDDTMLLDADGVLELNSSAGAISIGNDADAQGINVGTAGVRPIVIGNASAGTTVLLNSPANIGITLQNSIRVMTGAGSPNGAVTAPAGSLWLRTDPAGATSRIYVNTDSATTWTNVTCAA
jgi:hypothetical protein